MSEFVEVIKKKKEMCNCYGECDVCPIGMSNNFYGIDCESFIYSYPQKAEKIIMDWKKPIDWSKVDVDTPILVRHYMNEDWVKRHFARYEDGRVYTWNNGKTSWSIYDEGSVSDWKYAKLADEGESE